jgi:hypothetical protein
MMTEDEARERERDKYQCTCECERIYDPERIRRAGGDPSDPEVLVFHHSWECLATRIHWAPLN